MKRRSLLKSVAAIPAVAALPAPVAAQPPAPPVPDLPKLDLAPHGSVGMPVSDFFSGDELAALKRLADLLVPHYENRPGASAAGAAEFLDFYISRSNPETQRLYKSGLDRLNAEAVKLGRKSFTELTADEAAVVLKPMSTPWAYPGPEDPFARFLQTAKDDVLRATANSRPYAQALAATSRGSAGVGYYWFPIE